MANELLASEQPTLSAGNQQLPYPNPACQDCPILEMDKNSINEAGYAVSAEEYREHAEASYRCTGTEWHRRAGSAVVRKCQLFGYETE